MVTWRHDLHVYDVIMNATVWQYSSKKGSIGEGAYFPYYYSNYVAPAAKRQSVFSPVVSQYDKVTSAAPHGAGEKPEKKILISFSLHLGRK